MKNCFIIVNYNDYKSTKHLVKNIVDYKIIDHIVIIDNNSNSEEKELLSTINNRKVEIIYNEENVGYSSAINQAAKYLIDKYKKVNFIISQSDIVIMSEEDLNRMIELLNNELVGLVGPQILEKGKITRGWKNISPTAEFFMNIPIFHTLVEDKKLLYDDSYYENEISSVDVISSCFFLISGENLQKVNYLDENIFLYYEDYILCKKMKEMGQLVVVYNNVKVKHLYSTSVNKEMSRLEKYQMIKSSQYYYQTTYNKANKFERFILRLSASIGFFIKKHKTK